MKSLMRFGLLVLLQLSVLNNAYSQRSFFTLKQPNGIELSVRETGYCCFLKWYETPEGDVVLRGPDQYYYYAEFDHLDGFRTTNYRAGIDTPGKGIRKPLELPRVKERILETAQEFNVAAAKNLIRFKDMKGKTPRYNNLLNLKNRQMISSSSTMLDFGVLLVEFNDMTHHTPAYSKSDFERMLFSEDEYHTDLYQVRSPDLESVYGSVNDFYQVQSSGELTLVGDVTKK